MTQIGYQRIKAALATLSADEAEMILLSLAWLAFDEPTEPAYKKAADEARQFLRFRKTDQD
jgi:hypothetical protein